MPGRRPALLLAWACLLAREVSAWSHSETSLAQSVLSRALPVSEDVLNDFKKMTPPDAVISSRIVAFSLSSFLVGVAAGVVATLLILGVLTDRIPRIHMPQKDEEAAVAAGAPERDNPEQAAAASTTCSTSSSLPEAGLPAESLHLFMPRCSWLAAMLLVQSVPGQRAGSLKLCWTTLSCRALGAGLLPDNAGRSGRQRRRPERGAHRA